PPQQRGPAHRRAPFAFQARRASGRIGRLRIIPRRLRFRPRRRVVAGARARAARGRREGMLLQRTRPRLADAALAEARGPVLLMTLVGVLALVHGWTPPGALRPGVQRISRPAVRCAARRDRCDGRPAGGRPGGGRRSASSAPAGSRSAAAPARPAQAAGSTPPAPPPQTPPPPPAARFPAGRWRSGSGRSRPP